jgi:hypothetical protein
MAYPKEILRFVLEDNSVVSFYDYGNDMEIAKMMRFQNVRTVDVSVDRFGKARVITPRTEGYSIFEITFRRTAAYGNDVLDKIETLYDEIDSYGNPKKLMLYWQYAVDATLKTKVNMMREDFIRIYAMGDRMAGELSVTFIEVDMPVPLERIAYNMANTNRTIAVNLE